MSTVFGSRAVPDACEKTEFLARFTLLEGQGGLGGLSAVFFNAHHDVVFVRGTCPENNMVVGAYKKAEPDDVRVLTEMGFSYDPNLDIPAINMRRLARD